MDQLFSPLNGGQRGRAGGGCLGICLIVGPAVCIQPLRIRAGRHHDGCIDLRMNKGARASHHCKTAQGKKHLQDTGLQCSVKRDMMQRVRWRVGPLARLACLLVCSRTCRLCSWPSRLSMTRCSRSYSRDSSFTCATRARQRHTMRLVYACPTVMHCVPPRHWLVSPYTITRTPIRPAHLLVQLVDLPRHRGLEVRSGPAGTGICNQKQLV